jgi:hypothetical protein
MAKSILAENPSNSTSFNLALKTIMLINNDRKQGINGAIIATSQRKEKNSGIISVVGFLNRVALPFKRNGGFA